MHPTSEKNTIGTGSEGGLQTVLNDPSCSNAHKRATHQRIRRTLVSQLFNLFEYFFRNFESLGDITTWQ